LASLPLIVAEADVAAFVTLEDAWRAIRDVFVDVANDDAVNYPVVRETLRGSPAVFGVKTAQYRRHRVVGLKAGGYFPANAAHGDTNHQSYVVLFDDETGKPRAMVGGNLLTRLRTAAAAALSIDVLAKPDARTLAVIGAGAQAETHIRAALLARPFKRIVLWNRSRERATQMASRWTAAPPIDVFASAEAAVRQADVVITLTNATHPIVHASWVQPGCHLACMGADTSGKQEVDVALVRSARVFTDALTQAVSIGECQAAYRGGQISQNEITMLGDVLRGVATGRTDDAQITLFDGTGVAAQDIAMAAIVAERAAGAARPA
jgi:alanine dehydrogenase